MNDEVITEFLSFSVDERIMFIRDYIQKIYDRITKDNSIGEYKTRNGNECTISRTITGRAINYMKSNPAQSITLYQNIKKELDGTMIIEGFNIISIPDRGRYRNIEGTLQELEFLIDVNIDTRNLERNNVVSIDEDSAELYLVDTDLERAFESLSLKKRVEAIKDLTKRIYDDITSKYKVGTYTTISGELCNLQSKKIVPDEIKIKYKKLKSSISLNSNKKGVVAGGFVIDGGRVVEFNNDMAADFPIKGTKEEYRFLLHVLMDTKKLDSIRIGSRNWFSSENSILQDNQFSNTNMSNFLNSAYPPSIYNDIMLPTYTNNKHETPKNKMENPLLGKIPEGVSLVDYFLANAIGLEEVKAQVQKLVDTLEFDKKTEDYLEKEIPNLHMVFTGPAGSGKTMMAHAIANIFHTLGVLDKNKLRDKNKPVHVVNGTELFGRFVGDEEAKVKNAVHSAIGGVLLIDEAYAIFDSKGGYGKDVVATFLTELEEHKHELSVIFAGYPKEMNDFLKMNPGLLSRIGHKFSFDNYKPEELLEMLMRKIKKIGFEVNEETKEKMLDVIEEASKYEDFGNGRFIDNLYASIREEHASNTKKEINKEVLQTLTKDDVTKKILKELMNPDHITNTAKKGMKLEDLVGLEKVKEQIEELKNLLEFSNKSGISLEELDINLNMAFVGNPGTGKTTVANFVSDLYSKLGLIKTNKVISVSATDLIAGYVGQTGTKTRDVIESAKGGVLVIDEAYALMADKNGAGADYARQCFAEILLAMDKKDVVIIFAGYKDEMKEFLDYNPGTSSRLGTIMEFEDYTKEQLTEITLRCLHKIGFSTNEDIGEKIQEVHEKALKYPKFGNARFAEKLSQNIIRTHANNCRYENDPKKLLKISPEDVTSAILIGLTGYSVQKKPQIGFTSAVFEEENKKKM